MNVRRFESLITTENLAAVLALLALAIYPFVSSLYNVLNAAYFLSFAIMSLSLALVWGYAGIFSFGQLAFFGVGAYAYGILAINFPSGAGSLIALLVAILAAGLGALALGYFMFYGGVNGVFVSLVTLSVTLMGETFLSQTAGEEWRVGQALLGGFNGLRPIPSLSIGFGDWSFQFFGTSFFFLVLALFSGVYVGLRLLVRTKWGYGLIALREDRNRTETFGYNVRLQQTLVFGLGGVLAGLSGVLYASWGNFVTPSVMGLTSAVMPVILVAAGGRQNLTAASIASVVLLWLSQKLSSTGTEYALVILGALLVVVVLFVPSGAVVAIFDLIDEGLSRVRRLGRRRQGGDEGAEAAVCADD